MKRCAVWHIFFIIVVCIQAQTADNANFYFFCRDNNKYSNNHNIPEVFKKMYKMYNV